MAGRPRRQENERGQRRKKVTVDELINDKKKVTLDDLINDN